MALGTLSVNINTKWWFNYLYIPYIKLRMLLGIPVTESAFKQCLDKCVSFSNLKTHPNEGSKC